MSPTTVIIVIVVAIVVVALVALVYRAARQRQSDRLRNQYGPEYDRVVGQAESQRGAESELRERSKRQEGYDLRNLDPSERADFERRWSEVQGQFVDDPGTAVRSADRLVTEVMTARGYPVDDFDQRADDLSVRHADVTQRYREARRVAQANLEGTVTTEDLRQAVTNYRSLVQALLADDVDSHQRDDGPNERDREQIREQDREQDRELERDRDFDQTTERETRA
ncbi:hypothetical protein ACWEOW_05265 [Monashia sp. NPDC004114]